MQDASRSRPRRGSAKNRSELAARGASIGAGEDFSRLARLFIFDTDVSLQAYPGDGQDPTDPATIRALDDALEEALGRCLFFERTLSRTRGDSDIARAHAAAPAPVEVAPETAELVGLALGYCEASGGLFDVTMGTVTSLWDFHTGRVPSRLAPSRALGHGGFERIGLDAHAEPPTLSIDDPETILDLGGIAKGYIADDLADLLASRGVERFVLNLGGNVLVRGGRPGTFSPSSRVRPGDPWRIGIVNPRDPAHHRAIVDVASGSVVTSGLSERCFTAGGVTYHHILDPATGMPASTDVASATIVAERSLDCDGWSTTALMLGSERAIEFIERLPGVEAVIITDRDEVLWTPGIAESLSLIPTLPAL